MNHPTNAGGRVPLSPLSRVAAAALGILALALAWLMWGVMGQVIAPIAMLMSLAVVFAALVAAGRRWAPALGGLLSAAVAALMLMPGPGHDLRVPGTPGFAPYVILMAAALVGVIAGVGALLQNYRHTAGQAKAPRWLAPGMLATVGVCLGAIVVAAVPRPTAAAGVSEEMLRSLPALTTRDFRFDQTEIRVRVGETVALRLENPDPAPHSFDVDELNVHAPMPAGQTSLALLRVDRPGIYTFYCAPHYDKKTGRGMKGTLIVEP